MGCACENKGPGLATSATAGREGAGTDRWGLAPSSQQELGRVHTEVLSQTRASVAGGLWGTQATRPHGREQLAQAQATAQAAGWLRAPAALTVALVCVAASGDSVGWVDVGLSR